MKKRVKRSIALLLSLIMVAACVGCNKGADQDATVKKGITVWSAPSTVKVARDDISYANKGEAKLEYNAVRNEYESQQLMITTTKKVEKYDIEISDLTDGSNTLSKDNIEVYNEWYIELDDNVYENQPMPDALIPLDAARDAGELTIAKNNNAALWITIYVPKETPAGTYAGTFKLTVDKEEMDIPVSVKVNDYTLTDELNAKTLFTWRYSRVAAGELDASTAMMETYYEFFQDYRISLQSMPLEALTGEEFKEALIKYYDDLSTYTILSKVGDISLAVLNDKNLFKEQIFAIAELSAEQGRNMFDKAMFYMIDEALYYNPGAPESLAAKINKLGEYLQECVNEIKADKTGIYDNFKKMAGWQESILDIPNVMPSTPDCLQWLVEHSNDANVKALLELRSMNCICPQFTCTDKEFYPDLVAMCEKYNIDLWWYGCNFPAAPAGNYHIGDENLLGGRSVSWLQKKYDFSGNLYWGAASYTLEGDKFVTNNQFKNTYSDGQHIEWGPAGDGTLSYPGAAYGVYGPLPSMRLMSIRDGMEEYELLLDMENTYKSLQDKYGKDFSVAKSTEGFYSRLYDGNYSLYSDGENHLDFDKIRGELIDTVVNIKKGMTLAVQKDNVVGNTAYVSYYLPEGYTVTIDGEAQQAVSGCKYEYELDLEKDTYLSLTIESDAGEKYEVSHYIEQPYMLLQALSAEADLEGFQVTEGSSVQLVNKEEYTTDGTGVHAQINGVITGNEIKDAIFVPTLTVSTKMFEGISKISELSSLKMNVYNPGEEYIVTVLLNAGSSYSEAGTITIRKGMNELELNIGTMDFSAMDKVDAISFTFANSADGVSAMHYEMYLDNIVGLK